MPTSKVRRGKTCWNRSTPVPLRHGGGDGDDLVVLLGLLDQRLSPKTLVIGRRIGLGLDLGAGDHVEFVDAVIFVVGGFGGGIALALLGDDMDQHGAADIGVADILQNRQQMVEIMAVDRADIKEAQLLEQCAAGDIGAGVFHGARDGAIDAFRQLGGQALPTSRSLR